MNSKPRFTIICGRPVEIKRPMSPAERMFMARTGKQPLLAGFDFKRGANLLNEWLHNRRSKA